MERKIIKPKRVRAVYYSKDFKVKVIEEYLAGNCTKVDLLRKYDIRFRSAIQTWMKYLGYLDLKNAPILPVLKVHSLKKIKSKAGPPGQKSRKELERELQDAQLLIEAYAKIIEKAEQEYKISIRKKSNTK